MLNILYKDDAVIITIEMQLQGSVKWWNWLKSESDCTE